MSKKNEIIQIEVKSPRQDAFSIAVGVGVGGSLFYKTSSVFSEAEKTCMETGDNCPPNDIAQNIADSGPFALALAFGVIASRITANLMGNTKTTIMRPKSEQTSDNETPPTSKPNIGEPS